MKQIVFAMAKFDPTISWLRKQLANAAKAASELKSGQKIKLEGEDVTEQWRLAALAGANHSPAIRRPLTEGHRAATAVTRIAAIALSIGPVIVPMVTVRSNMVTVRSNANADTRTLMMDLRPRGRSHR